MRAADYSGLPLSQDRIIVYHSMLLLGAPGTSEWLSRRLPSDMAGQPANGATMRPIAPEDIRHIKLGPGGAWEKRAITRGEIYFGRGVDHEHLLAKGDWDGLIRFFRKSGRSPAVANYFAREARDSRPSVRTACGSCLLLAFYGGASPHRR